MYSGHLLQTQSVTSWSHHHAHELDHQPATLLPLEHFAARIHGSLAKVVT